MEQEDNKLLLKDICARLPYGVMVDYDSHIYLLNEIDPSCKDIDYITVRIQDVERLMCAKNVMIEHIKPYLRPMSSMTKEEKEEYDSKRRHICDEYNRYCFDTVESIDWLNKYHFDYRGLIEKGLALEAPVDMYI